MEIKGLQCKTPFEAKINKDNTIVLYSIVTLFKYNFMHISLQAATHLTLLK